MFFVATEAQDLQDMKSQCCRFGGGEGGLTSVSKMKDTALSPKKTSCFYLTVRGKQEGK